MNDPDKHEVKRDEKGKWLPGTSPNPAGRPKRKTITELIHAKLDNTPEGWEKLTALFLSKMFSPEGKDLLKELWHYTDGMPKQTTDITTGGDKITNITVKGYGPNDPLQLQAARTKPASDPRFISSGSLSGSELASQSTQNDFSGESINQMGSNI